MNTIPIRYQWMIWVQYSPSRICLDLLEINRLLDDFNDWRIPPILSPFASDVTHVTSHLYTSCTPLTLQHFSENAGRSAEIGRSAKEPSGW